MMPEPRKQTLEERFAEMKARQKLTRRELAYAKNGSIKCGRVGCKKRIKPRAPAQTMCPFHAREKFIADRRKARLKWLLKHPPEERKEERRLKSLWEVKLFCGQLLQKPAVEVTEEDMRIIAERV